MNTTSCFFTADYRDGQVYYAGKKYPAGHFTVTLMNQYYKNDTAARIAVFSGFGFRILGQLRDGFLNVRVCRLRSPIFSRRRAARRSVNTFAIAE